MPPLVARNLFGKREGAPDQMSVTVTYRRLQKGTPRNGRCLEVQTHCRLPKQNSCCRAQRPPHHGSLILAC